MVTTKRTWFDAFKEKEDEKKKSRPVAKNKAKTGVKNKGAKS